MTDDLRGQPIPESEKVVNQAGERRSTSIESLRAIAALAVFGGHIVGVVIAVKPGIPVPVDGLNIADRVLYGGGTGVFLFFGLTGYLLFWPFAKRHFGGGDRISLGKYATNRILRLVPLYLVAVTVVLLIQLSTPIETWLRFAFFFENFSDATVGQYLGVAWSLVVEIHFYILLPFLAWGLARLSRQSLGMTAAILLGLGLLSFLVRFETIYTADVVDPIWRFNLPANFMFFVPGMLLALLRLHWNGSRPGWLRGGWARSDFWILAAIPLWLVVVLHRFYLDPALLIASFLLIGACVLPLEHGPLTRSLRWKPLALIGVVSYSLYLWHGPVLNEIVSADVVATEVIPLALVSVPIVIVVSALSYAAIEAPFLRLRRQWSRSSAQQERGASQVQESPG